MGAHRYILVPSSGEFLFFCSTSSCWFQPLPSPFCRLLPSSWKSNVEWSLFFYLGHLQFLPGYFYICLHSHWNSLTFVYEQGKDPDTLLHHTERNCINVSAWFISKSMCSRSWMKALWSRMATPSIPSMRGHFKYFLQGKNLYIVSFTENYGPQDATGLFFPERWDGTGLSLATKEIKLIVEIVTAMHQWIYDI